MAAKPTIQDLEALLNSEEDIPIQILPNGEIRQIGQTSAAETGNKKQSYQMVATLPGTQMQTVQRRSDGAFIPFDPANRDYAEYCAWVAEGNEPDPAPEPQTPPAREA